MSGPSRSTCLFLATMIALLLGCQTRKDSHASERALPTHVPASPAVVSYVKIHFEAPIEPENVTVIPFYSPQGPVVFDRSGAIWYVASEDDASASFVRWQSRAPTMQINVSKPDISISDLAFDSQGILWFAFSPIKKPWGVGFGSLSGEQRFSLIPGTAGQVSSQIAPSSSGDIWISTAIDYELLYLKAGISPKSYSVEAYRMAVDSKNRAWFANEQGLGYTTDSGLAHFLTLAPPNEFLLSRQRFGSLSVTGDDSIWFSFGNPPTVARLDTHNKLRLYQIPLHTAYPPLLAACGDAKVWVSAQVDESWLGLLNIDGSVSQLRLPTMRDVDYITSDSCQRLALTADVPEPKKLQKKRVVLILI